MSVLNHFLCEANTQDKHPQLASGLVSAHALWLRPSTEEDRFALHLASLMAQVFSCASSENGKCFLEDGQASLSAVRNEFEIVQTLKNHPVPWLHLRPTIL